jgi:hypothetical protein
MTRKLKGSDMASAADIVLKPWKRRKDAKRVQIVKVT